MKRFLNDANMEIMKHDFGFLIKTIKKSFGELDLRLRGHYFNLYYKGNSAAKISFRRGYYEIMINRKFSEGVFNHDRRFKNVKRSKDYNIYKLSDSKQLAAFFQKKHLNKLYSNIKKVNYGEEIVFEQALITDNRGRKDLIVIDRQITEPSLKKKRMDLLALKKIAEGKYGFLIIEVKLGNNKELKSEVASQLLGYINHVKSEDNFYNWKECYEKVYKQMRELGLIDEGPASLEIINDVKGLVLVGQYSGFAKVAIEKLRADNPELEIKPLVNWL